MPDAQGYYRNPFCECRRDLLHDRNEAGDHSLDADNERGCWSSSWYRMASHGHICIRKPHLDHLDPRNSVYSKLDSERCRWKFQSLTQQISSKWQQVPGGWPRETPFGTPSDSGNTLLSCIIACSYTADIMLDQDSLSPSRQHSNFHLRLGFICDTCACHLYSIFENLESLDVNGTKFHADDDYRRSLLIQRVPGGWGRQMRKLQEIRDEAVVAVCARVPVNMVPNRAGRLCGYVDMSKNTRSGPLH